MIADGKQIAAKIEIDLQEQLLTLPEKYLCFIVVGENAASEQFVAMKSRIAKRLGVHVAVERFSQDINQQQLQDEVTKICDEGFDGVVIQLPLPSHLDEQAVLDCVPVELDVDVLGTRAKEMYARGDSQIIPPVARAVWEILDFYKLDLVGKNIVVIGNGKLVGQPVVTMFGLKKVSVVVVDKNTLESEKVNLIKNADIIVSGIGASASITPEMIKDGVVLIDAGTSERSGKLVGDIDPACADKASFMTPVPGGVGPVTVVSLFKNLVVK